MVKNIIPSMLLIIGFLMTLSMFTVLIFMIASVKMFNRLKTISTLRFEKENNDNIDAPLLIEDVDYVLSEYQKDLDKSFHSYLSTNRKSHIIQDSNYETEPFIDYTNTNSELVNGNDDFHHLGQSYT